MKKIKSLEVISPNDQHTRASKKLARMSETGATKHTRSGSSLGLRVDPDLSPRERTLENVINSMNKDAAIAASVMNEDYLSEFIEALPTSAEVFKEAAMTYNYEFFSGLDELHVTLPVKLAKALDERAESLGVTPPHNWLHLAQLSQFATTDIGDIK